jgi:hypothetical protein
MVEKNSVKILRWQGIREKLKAKLGMENIVGGKIQ